MGSIQKPKSFSLSAGRSMPALFAIVFLFLFPEITCAQDKEASDSFVIVNSEKICYQIIGKGEPVVLIPGGPSPAKMGA
jgi:hypothetical protein